LRRHDIAVIPGDGIGLEVTPVGQELLEAAARRFGFELAWRHFPWGCRHYIETGRMMPEDGLE
jgi:tartrate dehydrogenase/decarboxylase/D-malate dehydrogenase